MSDLHFGPFFLNPLTRQLRKDENLVPLPAKAFDLLLLMARNPGRPLTKKELLQTVWAGTYVEDSNLTQSISILRKALGPEGDGIVVTLPGVGYQFAGRVTAVAPAQALQPVTVQTSESLLTIEEVTEERVRWWTSPAALTLAALGLIVLGVASWLGWERYEDRVGGPPVQAVLADTDGTTGDPVLDRTLTYLMRIELAQSPFVNLLPGVKVRAKLVEMEHKADEKLNPTLAREVCERTGSQAVIHSSVARAGNSYLLTAEATNCLDGTAIGAASQTVGKPEQLPRALAKLANSLRHSMGESRRTIARFRSPLYPARTSSLEALQGYSEAARLSMLGKFAEAADLLKKAVAIDPNFASAWADLSTLQLNAQDRAAGISDLQKAFDTREHATEPMQLYIVSRYNSVITGDLYEGLRNYQAWTEIYPRAPQPWSGLLVLDGELGKNSEALSAAKKTMDLAPIYLTSYVGLAGAQIRTRDFDGARSTCQAAIAHNLDGDWLRHLMLRLAYLQQDPVYLDQQEAWGREHPDSPFFIVNEAHFAIAHGRVKDGLRLLQQIRPVMEHNGQQELEATVVSITASYLVAVGEPQQARLLMSTVTQLPSNYEVLTASLDLDADASVQAQLAEQLKKQPRSTLWNEWYGPILRGKLLIKAHKPQDALAALDPTRRYDGKEFDGMYARGLGQSAAGQLPLAEATFRGLLAHPELNPPDILLPMAQIQLARVLALENRKPEAAEAYRTFLANWAQADAGQPLLLQVQKELQAL